jgi:hypothetical protein
MTSSWKTRPSAGSSAVILCDSPWLSLAPSAPAGSVPGSCLYPIVVYFVVTDAGPRAARRANSLPRRTADPRGWIDRRGATSTAFAANPGSTVV